MRQLWLEIYIKISFFLPNLYLSIQPTSQASPNSRPQFWNARDMETIIDKTSCRRSFEPHAIDEWANANGDTLATLIACKETVLCRLFRVPVIWVKITVIKLFILLHLNFNLKVRWTNAWHWLGGHSHPIVLWSYKTKYKYKYKLLYCSIVFFLRVSVHFKKKVQKELDFAFYIALSRAFNNKCKMYIDPVVSCLSSLYGIGALYIVLDNIDPSITFAITKCMR